jgi:hypothetical protein
MRIDMSDWLVHFVHRRNPENDPRSDHEDFIRVPIAFTDQSVPVFSDWDYWDEEDPIAPDDVPIVVMEKIINDGHLRANWSFRKGKPTIYGPRSAVCFTEMPLYALIEYAKARRDEESVATYGVALQKAELFRVGARPVIYGLSSDHCEATPDDEYYCRGCRSLAKRCGISPREQYRYVAMNLGLERRIDWSHEREWRWTKHYKADTDIPGLSLWLNDESHNFSKIVILVQTDEEGKRLLDLLKQYHDHPFTKYGVPLSLRSLKNTGSLRITVGC